MKVIGLIQGPPEVEETLGQWIEKLYELGHQIIDLRGGIELPQINLAAFLTSAWAVDMQTAEGLYQQNIPILTVGNDTEPWLGMIEEAILTGEQTGQILPVIDHPITQEWEVWPSSGDWRYRIVPGSLVQVAAKGSISNEPVVLIRKEGKKRWVHIQYNLTPPTSFIGSVVDWLAPSKVGMGWLAIPIAAIAIGLTWSAASKKR